MHRCILPKRSKHCPDTTLDPPQGLAATKYISLYIACRLRTAGRGVQFFQWRWRTQRGENLHLSCYFRRKQYVRNGGLCQVLYAKPPSLTFQSCRLPTFYHCENYYQSINKILISVPISFEIKYLNESLHDTHGIVLVFLGANQITLAC